MLEQLAVNCTVRDKGVDLLRQAGSLSGEEAARAVLAWTRHPDYLVRSRAWVTLCRAAHPAIIPDLINYLREERDEEFRLRCLDVLQCLKEPETVPLLAPFLHDRDPLVVRGTVWTIGAIGGEEAARALLSFGASPAGRLVRREVVGEAVALALAGVPGREEVLARVAGEDRRVARYLADLPLDHDGKPRFSLYPSPDYFRLQCQAREVDYKTFKRLME